MHAAKNIDKLKASVAQFGFVTPILLDGAGVIIAGHGRYAAAKALGSISVPTVVADQLSEAEVRALRSADNKLAELSDWNDATLQIEFAELMDLSLDGELDFGLDITGFETPEIDVIIDGGGRLRSLKKNPSKNQNRPVKPWSLETRAYFVEKLFLDRCMNC